MFEPGFDPCQISVDNTFKRFWCPPLTSTIYRHSATSARKGGGSPGPIYLLRRRQRQHNVSSDISGNRVRSINNDSAIFIQSAIYIEQTDVVPRSTGLAGANLQRNARTALKFNSPRDSCGLSQISAFYPYPVCPIAAMQYKNY